MAFGLVKTGWLYKMAQQFYRVSNSFVDVVEVAVQNFSVKFHRFVKIKENVANFGVRIDLSLLGNIEVNFEVLKKVAFSFLVSEADKVCNMISRLKF